VADYQKPYHMPSAVGNSASGPPYPPIPPQADESNVTHNI